MQIDLSVLYTVDDGIRDMCGMRESCWGLVQAHTHIEHRLELRNAFVKIYTCTYFVCMLEMSGDQSIDLSCVCALCAPYYLKVESPRFAEPRASYYNHVCVQLVN